MVAAVVGACRPAVASYVTTLVAAVADVGNSFIAAGFRAVSADVPQVAAVVALAVIPLTAGAVS